MFDISRVVCISNPGIKQVIWNGLDAVNCIPLATVLFQSLGSLDTCKLLINPEIKSLCKTVLCLFNECNAPQLHHFIMIMRTNLGAPHQ